MTEWKGAEALRPHLVPIGTLTRHPLNPKHGAVEEISQSLNRFGQVRMILVDDTNTVVAGNHTLLAAERLGWTHVAVVLNTFASGEEALAYLLADNRLGDLGENDRSELLLIVEEIEKSGNWAGTGYIKDDLDHYRALEAASTAAPAPVPDEAELGPAPPAALREIVLLFDEEQQAAFGENVRKLRPRYQLEGVTETVLRAIRDESLLVNQGKS